MHWKLELRTTYDSNVARVKEKVYKCVFWLIANGSVRKMNPMHGSEGVASKTHTHTHTEVRSFSMAVID